MDIIAIFIESIIVWNKFINNVQENTAPHFALQLLYFYLIF